MHSGDKPIIRLGAYIGGAFAMFFFAILGCVVQGVGSLFGTAELNFADKEAGARGAALDQILSEQQTALSEVKIDETKQIARIPITSALPIALADLQKAKPKASSAPVPGTDAANKAAEAAAAAEKAKTAPTEEKKPEAAKKSADQKPASKKKPHEEKAKAKEKAAAEVKAKEKAAAEAKAKVDAEKAKAAKRAKAKANQKGKGKAQPKGKGKGNSNNPAQPQ